MKNTSSTNTPDQLAVYTVVLTRPDYVPVGDNGPGDRVYVGYMLATDPVDALRSARNEVYMHDIQDRLAPSKPEDYPVLVIFNGQCPIARFGWQLT